MKILKEFGLPETASHIINGHIPVNRGENPIKADGKIVVIDGGFCKAYHGATGIGGYTLVYNAEGLKLIAHEPFTGKENAIKNNADIISSTTIFESKSDRMRIRECDKGDEIREKIADLILLMNEYKSGNVK